MNSWKIVGVIFLALGILVLFGGLYYATTVSSLAQAVTDTANNYFDVIPQQTGSIVFMFALAPFAIGSVICFIIAAIGLIMGSKRAKQTLPPPPLP